MSSPRPLRVLHITYGLDFGGVETHLRLIAEAAAKRHRHEFCAIAKSGHAFTAIQESGAPAFHLGCDPWKQPVRTIGAIGRLIRERSPDLVHCHGSEGNIFGLGAAFLTRTPIRIGEEIGVSEHSAKARVAMRLIYSSATAVIAVADAVAQRLVQWGEARPGKIVTLYNPIDLPAVRASPRKPGERLRIAYVGRLDPVKNPLGLIEGLKLAVQSGVDAELLMAGDGPLREHAEMAAADPALAGRVILPGFVDGPATLIAASHVFVQPSLSEGLSLALVEAMAVGVPVVSTANGGSVEVIEEGRNGWLLQSSDAQSIADVLIQTAGQDPGELHAMGQRGMERAQAFGIADYILRLEALYDEWAQSKRMFAR